MTVKTETENLVIIQPHHKSSSNHHQKTTALTTQWKAVEENVPADM